MIIYSDKSGKEDSKCDVKKKKKAEEDDDSIPVHLLVSQTNDTQKWKEKLALKGRNESILI